MKMQTSAAVSGRYDDMANYDRVAANLGARDAARLDYSLGGSGKVSSVDAKPPKSPSADDEVAFVNGLKADGTINSNSYWGSVGKTAYKWGSDDHAGTSGGTVKYYFEPGSNWSAAEKATWVQGFSMWAAVADIKFVETKTLGDANVQLHRGGGGAYTSLSTTRGSGDELGHPTGRGLIAVDTSIDGFELDGGFDTFGGYGLSTVIHEIGHLIGLGHGGAYNGSVDPASDQFSAYDDRMYTIMSYIFWGYDDAKYLKSNPYQDTDWGITDDGIRRQAPHTVMQLDIQAIQQIYGVSKDSPFEGGQTYGFHSNIQGALHDYFDFTVNTNPVVTLYNQGTNNTLDLSGYSDDQRIDLHGGAFSDVAGHTNNVAVAQGTVIDHVVGGSGNDTIVASDVGTTITGGLGVDIMSGGAGADTWVFDDGDSGKKAKKADDITNFSHANGDKVDLQLIDAIKGGGDDKFTWIGTNAFDGAAGELRYEVKGGNLMLMMDTDGNGKADIMIHLDHLTTIDPLTDILL